ncbi:MAG: TIM barrel protein [Bacillota bacterium]|nr:TIM barrel protein [Bacillota bacterium]
MAPLFGPAGNAESFYAAGFTKTAEAPAWLKGMGLTAYEFQSGHGVKLGDATAELIRKEAIKNNIAVSIHAPYYISLSSVDDEKRLNSIRYVVESAEAVKKMGGSRIVVHSGSAGKMDRRKAIALAKDTVSLMIEKLHELRLDDVFVCFETMGKINQLGTLEEVLELCTMHERFLPTIDFGHINARTQGSIKTKADYAGILDMVGDSLGKDRLKVFHCHFSKIEYSAGGEKKHLTFEDTVYGPEFSPLAELIYERNLSPVMICESSGTQAEDALAMKSIYDTVIAKEGNI